MGCNQSTENGSPSHHYPDKRFIESKLSNTSNSSTEEYQNDHQSYRNNSKSSPTRPPSITNRSASPIKPTYQAVAQFDEEVDRASKSPTKAGKKRTSMQVSLWKIIYYFFLQKE